MLTASDILYTSWEEIPLRKIQVVLQILPSIRWDVHNHWGNTYAKNFLLKQLFRSTKTYKQTTPEQRVDLFTHEIGWIKEFPTSFPIPSYKLGVITFYAPPAGMSDITVERLMEADIALYRYIHSHKSTYMAHFLAMIFTSKDSKLTDEELEQHGALLYKIPDQDKIAAIRSFIGCFQLLRKQCPTLFPVIASDEGEKQSRNNDRHPERSRGQGAKDPAKSWQNLLFELANTPGYPGMEAAKHSLAWESLPYMDHEQEKIVKQNSRLKSSVGN